METTAHAIGRGRLAAILSGVSIALGFLASATWALDAGESIALRGIPDKAPACATCHGAHGEGGGDGLYPRVAGLPTAYLETQLKAFRDGSRSNALMSPMAKVLTDADIAAVADYFNRQAPEFPVAPGAKQAQLARGQALVTIGDWAHGVPSCVSCHGPVLQGVAPAMPALSGQWPRYIAAQLEAFRHSTRPGGPLGLMSRIASGLSDDDTRDVALYIASLRPGVMPEIPRPSAPEAYRAVAQSPDAFTPPPEASMPDGPFGDMVRLGENIFEDTPKHAGKYVGNTLSCRNCHLDRGRHPRSSPMWAAYVHYPQYRKKDGTVNTLQARIQGCFRYSENGAAPAADSPEITALASYFYWLATGLPVGIAPKAVGYPKLESPKEPPSPARGARVYAAKCALCHGEDGAGRNADGKPVFPALWGSRSFNWGAGMHQVDMAAAFIKSNMPYAAGGTLTDQEAWDVAVFVNSRPRPQDPRFTESVEKTRLLYHKDHKYDYYGREIDGKVLGAPSANRP